MKLLIVLGLERLGELVSHVPRAYGFYHRLVLLSLRLDERWNVNHWRKVVPIDPNVRVRGGMTYVGTEDVPGAVKPGERVCVRVPETDLRGDARVSEVDDVRGLVVLDVDWPSLVAE